MLRTLGLPLGAALVAGFSFAAAAPANAQMLCGDHEKVVAHLDKKFGEIRTNMGMSSNGGVLEVYSSEKTGTWTVLMTMPGGPTCLVAAGESWEKDSSPEKVKGEVS
jgi:hypothetical protein